MQVEYRQLFLKDLKKLKKQSVYKRIMELAFEILPHAEELKDLTNLKALKGYPNRYRIRVGQRDPAVLKDTALHIKRRGFL